MTIRVQRSILAAAALLGVAASVAPAPVAGRESRMRLEDTTFTGLVRGSLEAGFCPGTQWPKITDARDSVESLYRLNGWQPVWTRAGRPTGPALAMLEVLRAAADRGLSPADFDAGLLGSSAEALARAVAPPSSRELAFFDLGLSVDVARLVAALHGGSIPAIAVHPGFRLSPPALDLVGVMDALRRADGPGPILKGVEPGSVEYRRLLGWLVRYRGLAKDSTLRLPLGLPRKFGPGDPLSRASRLRRLLTALGDLDLPPSAPIPADTSYDETLVAGIRRFQARHGIVADGVIGPATAEQLVRPIESRVRQIELALQRERWLPRPLPPRAIVVNLAAFRSTAGPTDGHDGTLTMSVIAGGAREHETPRP